MNTEIIEHQKIATIVDNVGLAKADVVEAFRLLRAARDRLKATLGDGSHYYHHFIDYGLSDFSIGENKTPIEAARRINRNAWAYMIDQVGIKQLMTPARRKEMEKQLEDDELPELTVDNVLGTLCSLAGRVDDLLIESMRYVFDWLRPWNSALKTNDPWKIGSRVIVVYGSEVGWGGGGFHLRYSKDAEFRALGNVFSLLDGKGVEKYPDDLYTRFNEGMKDQRRGDKFRDQYFEFKCYRNGNIHIKFLRPDLVAKLNKTASENELPGQKK